ncbi:MFS transporter [Micrococcus terreus]|uniref:MFS transporter, MHS family, proline/betaine transporter n=1 Tax=Micrococcus terreus TaxID=574650 RepID=A0A1I7MT06_9MICC|nr:MFS transporter [Micrococcus terreus]SFV25054.1 MFS transporter, MHS family, proline/betaine transporter [Micrococcus terreus]
MTATPPAPGQRIGPQGPTAQQRKTAVLASGVGTVIEWYDYMAYAFLAVTLASLFFATGEPGVALLSTLAIFGVSFLFRPLGGIVFGHIADRFGRRPALTISVVGMAATSSLIGFLPVFQDVGLLAPVLLVLLRAVQGIAAGGEMASAATYASEASTVRRRGFDVSFVNLGLIIGTALGAVVVGLLYAGLAEEQMLSWGWRVPFWLSIPMGLAALLIRRHMEESAEFERAQQLQAQVTRSPIWGALREQPRQVFMVTAMNLGSFAAFYIVFTYLSTYFQTQGIMTASQASWSSVAALAVAGASVPLWGRLSDRIGRRPVFIGASVALVVLAYPLFLMMKQGLFFAVAGQLVLGIFEAAYLGVLLAAYTELFAPSLRVSGVALGYNFSSILAGGPAPYVSAWLIQATGIAEAPAFFVMVAAGLSLLATLALYEETAGRPLPGQEATVMSADDDRDTTAANPAR